MSVFEVGGEMLGALIRVLRILEEADMYFEGLVRGDGAEFEEGHSSVNPAGI